MLGAKNLIPYPYGQNSRTDNGVTYTVNTDGSVTVNGTATANSTFVLQYRITPSAIKLEVGRTYRLTGGKSNQLSIGVSTEKNGSASYYGYDRGNGLEFMPQTGDTSFGALIQVTNGSTVNNVTVYPMIRLASDPDDTYQPYAMTNRELTENLFYKNKELKSSDNLDDITKTGLYYIYDSVPTNSPESISYCTVIVNQIKGIIQQTVIKSTASARCSPEPSTASAGSIYVRTKSGSPLAWKPWMKFTGTVVS